MSFKDLYGNSEHRTNLAHFASITTLAAVDGAINTEELKLLDRFATKLNITKAEYKEVMKKGNKYPIDPPISSKVRLERLYDLFRIIYADHEIDEEEFELVNKYAIGLGFSNDNADAIIRRSILIFSGKINLEDYLYLVKK